MHVDDNVKRIMMVVVQGPVGRQCPTRTSSSTMRSRQSSPSFTWRSTRTIGSSLEFKYPSIGKLKRWYFGGFSASYLFFWESCRAPLSPKEPIQIQMQKNIWQIQIQAKEQAALCGNSYNPIVFIVILWQGELSRLGTAAPTTGKPAGTCYLSPCNHCWHWQPG